MNETKRTDIRGMTRIALCAAALCTSSCLMIPLPFTPIVLSLHTVIVNLIGLLMKPKQAACTILIYLMMGLMGMPVFSGGTAGPGKLFGPTGGFYFGFLFAAIAIAALKGTKPNSLRYAIVTIGAGIPIQHLFAIVFMCFHNGFDVLPAVTAVSLPFLPGDILKCVIASVIGTALNKTIRNP